MTHLEEQLQRPLQPKDGTAGIERPKALVDALPEDPEPLLEIAARHVVSSRQFDRATLIQLFRLAAQYEATPALMHLPLTGKILISAFYEPSTRTRLSFESAWHRLGGAIMSITDPKSTGMAKGESLVDIAEMFNNYGDVIVLRSSEDQAVYQMLEGLRIPIVNAGNGIDEHPTQALADVYTLAKWRPELFQGHVDLQARIRVGIIGVPSRMRTVRSLLLMLGRFPEAIREVVIISREHENFDSGQREELEAAGLVLRVVDQLDPVLPELDVVYINAIAWVGDTFESLGTGLHLTRNSPLKPGAIILHPLARGDELATDLDDTPHNWYFAQARGAVFVRMALLTSVVRRISAVMDTPEQ
ncbi:Aspartate carbamoyltransferase [Thioalkalivibrio nitratireducens DSM 14787]|uniref:Aspartate carbamoyltransferase n=1 Tax=Thioalkalivibrio nitratireducens (strain DSM 14787 / UNIQEM 213 / ALEN2) TaxID=1255043 RepID=L0E0N9_THIND|nr:aspartate carbamoyltransferase [Thioalkalivibrio nitratireducens]AGA35379.1 Aspartate carbamoyltransferase [Thioalkalivibrio nitratireducens DSM 14787]